MSLTPGRPDPPDARPWWVLCALAASGALLVAALPASWAANLDWQPGLVGREPWRALTAPFVHLSPLHLVANLLGTVLVAALGRVAGCGPRAALAWALAWPLTQLALRWQPTLLHYGGLSGVLHAAVAVVVVQLLLWERGPRQAVGAALGAGLLLKLASEAPWAGPLRQVPGWDIAIAPLAHATGTVAGAVCALAALRPAAPGGRGRAAG